MLFPVGEVTAGSAQASANFKGDLSWSEALVEGVKGTAAHRLSGLIALDGIFPSLSEQLMAKIGDHCVLRVQFLAQNCAFRAQDGAFKAILEVKVSYCDTGTSG